MSKIITKKFFNDDNGENSTTIIHNYYESADEYYTLAPISNQIDTNIIDDIVVTPDDVIIPDDNQIDNLISSQPVIDYQEPIEFLEAKEIITSNITSTLDLELNVEPNRSIIASNIKYRSMVVNDGIIDSISIKSIKVFVANCNILLETSNDCDGIEIIIYNNNLREIFVRNSDRQFVEKLCAGHSLKIMYVSIIDKWICC